MLDAPPVVRAGLVLPLAGFSFRSDLLRLSSRPDRVILRPVHRCCHPPGSSACRASAVRVEVVSELGLRLGFVQGVLSDAAGFDGRLLFSGPAVAGEDAGTGHAGSAAHVLVAGPRLDPGPGPDVAYDLLSRHRFRRLSSAAALRASHDDGWDFDCASDPRCTPRFDVSGRLVSGLLCPACRAYVEDLADLPGYVFHIDVPCGTPVTRPAASDVPAGMAQPGVGR